MRALGITAEEIDIRPAATQMLGDMGHPFAKGEPVYDITFENVQAGLRTDYLFRLANQHDGFVIGTAPDDNTVTNAMAKLTMFLAAIFPARHKP